MTASNFEIINLKGSQTDNLLIYQLVGSYDGQGVTDTFYADWSDKSAVVNWTHSSEPFISEGVTVSNIEGLLLQTGDSADVIDNTAFNANNDFRTGNGDDTISSGHGNDNVDAGAGNNVISLGAGSNTIVAVAGDDVVNVVAVPDHSQSDTLDGGIGTDTLRTLAKIT